MSSGDLEADLSATKRYPVCHLPTRLVGGEVQSYGVGLVAAFRHLD